MIIVQCPIWNRIHFKGLHLTRKLLSQGFLLVKLKSSLWKFYGAWMGICLSDRSDRFWLSLIPRIPIPVSSFGCIIVLFSTIVLLFVLLWIWYSTSLKKKGKHFFQSFPRSWLIIGFVTRLTRRVPLVEMELLTLPKHLSSLPVFSGVRVTRSLVLYVCFVDHCWLQLNK
jgi:hypothetical protein